MKDMYSFDTDEDAAMVTYREVREAYDWFFKQIDLPFVTVLLLEFRVDGRWMQREVILEDRYVMNTTMFPKVISLPNGTDVSRRGYFISVHLL